MTHRNYIQCDVCGSVILVRTQIGHLLKHPIRIHCAKCGILISGEFIQDKELPQFKIIFENATDCDIQEPDYYIEVSGELLTSKIRPYVKDKDEYPLPPFLKAVNSMSSDKTRFNENHAFLEFNHDFLAFLSFREKDWPFLRRLHEIWLSGNHEFLQSQMSGKLPSDMFPLNNELEYLRGLHQLFLIGFRAVLPKNFYSETTKSIWNSITDVSTTNSNGYLALTEFFFKNNLLDIYEERILNILNSFVDSYPFLVVAASLEYYQSKPDLSKNGTTMVSFEDIKNFYLECFEAIGELITIVVAYNNLKYRSDYKIMPNSEFAKIKTLQDFMDMRNKGNKVTFCESDEIFNKLIHLDADNGLRNAIGHGSYSYDGINQIITYYSSGTKGKGTDSKVYLVEFIQMALRQFNTIIPLIELIYQTRKFYYVQHGIVPISSSVFRQTKKQKIGRNELCPCGSGKKYKRCCGLNN